MTDKIYIQGLRNGEMYVITESDYGKAEVWRINDYLLLFSIPIYGGAPVFEASFTILSIDELLDLVNSWT